MKILIADKLSDACNKALEEKGHEVVVRAGLKGDDLRAAVGEEQPQALIVRSTKVPVEVIEAGRALELIVRAGAGYDNIDVEAASAHGVFVANCPGKNAAAVAELTIGLMLALDRALPDNVSDARGGQWKKAYYSKAQGVKGRTLGLIGLGNIGREVARRAQAFGMKVVAWSRSLTDETAAELGVRRADGPLEVARLSDIVSIHVAGGAETKNMADRAFFEAMKPGSFFINTSRSSVVDEEALRWALDEKGVRAAVDVMVGEPSGKEGPFEHPLKNHPSVYMTHHIGASTEQAQDAIATEAVRILLTYAETGQVLNCVNLEERSPATHLLTVRHLDKVGVLARVLDDVRGAGWNVQEMENLIFKGAHAACARIRFHGDAQEDVINRITAQEDVIAASVIAL